MAEGEKQYTMGNVGDGAQVIQGDNNIVVNQVQVVLEHLAEQLATLHL